ncbi:MAG TPA: HlyD family efflux transporter periplasmic adaptor subunit [Candidatus Solibacter sp.]|nr:HlyD family efflux transporter periplasmic adaptor subunit [Candidatus Solibacter sp.]
MMATAFSRTFARLLADCGRLPAFILATSLLALAGWLWWASRAQVTLYEVSTQARVELDAATYPIQSPLLGRVVATKLRVGQTVRRGDVLVEIDAMPDQLQLRQEQVSTRGLEPELARLRAQAAAEESARAEEQQAARLSAAEAGARIREADAAREHAEAELARTRKLHDEKLVSDRELASAEAEARRLHAAGATLESAARRVPQEQVTRDRERNVRLERLHNEIATLEAQRGTLRAGMERTAYEIERRRVRAPVDGRVAESATLRTGAVVQEGEKLASIVPSGRLLVAAQFPASAAFGRIRAGQPASLRLDGFPWAEFGTVAATVTRVAEEVREGNVRVELAIQSGAGFRGKLEHGMPGALEVAVERITPLSLILRAGGQLLAAHP